MSKLLIKNMVCQRCVMTVEDILTKIDIPFKDVSLGEVEVPGKISADQLKHLDESLKKVGFELIETRVNKFIEDIKLRVIDYISLGIDSQEVNLSSFITEKIPYDYSYISDLFSSIEGKTI